MHAGTRRYIQSSRAGPFKSQGDRKSSVGGTTASHPGPGHVPRFWGKVGVGRHWEGLPEMGVWVRIKICSVFLSSKKIWGNWATAGLYFFSFIFVLRF